MGSRMRTAAATAAVGLQLAVLYAPRAPAPPIEGIPFDKVVHALVFALPTVALIAAGAPRRWVIPLMALHAPLSEVVQMTILGHRSGEVGDVVADLVGVGLGAMFAPRFAPDHSVGTVSA